MAKKLLIFSLLFLFVSRTWAAHESRVWSRSIMASCEFVYQIQSDVIVELPEITHQKFNVPLYLRAQLKNSWDHEPNKSEVFIVKVDENRRASFTFESMSVSQGYLFREMYFQWVYEHEVGSFVALSPIQKADIGRRFGETCYTERFSDTQFVQRELL